MAFYHSFSKLRTKYVIRHDREVVYMILLESIRVETCCHYWFCFHRESTFYKWKVFGIKFIILINFTLRLVKYSGILSKVCVWGGITFHSFLLHIPIEHSKEDSFCGINDTIRTYRVAIRGTEGIHFQDHLFFVNYYRYLRTELHEMHSWVAWFLFNGFLKHMHFQLPSTFLHVPLYLVLTQVWLPCSKPCLCQLYLLL